MSHDRTDPTIRKGRSLVSTLASTPDNALETFRAQRAADPRLDLGLIAKARDILDAVAFALRSKNREDWRKIEQAWALVHDIAMPAEAPGGSPASQPPFGGEPVPMPADGAPDLTLEQYAALRAQRSVASPGGVSAVNRRYGVSGDEAAGQLDAAWNQRLHANVKEKLRYDELLIRFGEWLASEQPEP